MHPAHTSTPQTRPSSERLISRIDFLRGIFSIWVLIAHTYSLASSPRPAFNREWLSIQNWFHHFMGSGYYGVIGFFFLSGFCIQWSIQKQVASKNAADFSLPSYLIARFLRIAPLFYLGLLLALSLHWICLHCLQKPSYLPSLPPIDAWKFIASIGFLQGIAGNYPLFEPSWSITNEVFYYVAWPLILLCTQFRSLRAILLAIVAAFLLTGAFYMAWKPLSAAFPNMNSVALWTIPLSSLMWINGAFCRIYYEKILSSPLFPFLTRWWWILLILWVIWTTTLLTLGFSLFWRAALDPFGYLVIPLLILSDWSAPVSKKITTWLADLSYPLYLLHAQILVVTADALTSFAPGVSQIQASLAAGGFGLLFAGSIGLRLERLTIQWKNRLLKRV